MNHTLSLDIIGRLLQNKLMAGRFGRFTLRWAVTTYAVGSRLSTVASREGWYADPVIPRPTHGYA